MVHCVHKFNLFKCRLLFIANAKHFTYAEMSVEYFKSLSFSSIIIDCSSKQPFPARLRIKIMRTIRKRGTGTPWVIPWRAMALHLCRLQQQVTFFQLDCEPDAWEDRKIIEKRGTDALWRCIWWTVRTFIDFFKCSIDCNQLDKEIKYLKHLYFQLLWSCNCFEAVLLWTCLLSFAAASNLFQVDREPKSWELSKPLTWWRYWRSICWTFLKNRTLIDIFQRSAACNQFNTEFNCLKHLYFQLYWSCTIKSCSYREDEYHFSFSCFTRYL